MPARWRPRWWGRANGLQAAVVPRRGFERAEDYAAVLDFVLDKLGPKS
jgi:hypothetical protein